MLKAANKVESGLMHCNDACEHFPPRVAADCAVIISCTEWQSLGSSGVKNSHQEAEMPKIKISCVGYFLIEIIKVFFR